MTNPLAPRYPAPLPDTRADTEDMAQGSMLQAFGPGFFLEDLDHQIAAHLGILQVAWGRRSALLIDLGAYPDALDAADRQRALSWNPHQILEAERHRAEALAMLNRDDEALRALDAGLAIGRGDCDEASALAIRSWILALLGRHEEAVAQIDTAVAAHPWSAELRTRRADILARAARLEEAVADLEVATWLDPEYVVSRGLPKGIFDLMEHPAHGPRIQELLNRADDETWGRPAQAA